MDIALYVWEFNVIVHPKSKLLLGLDAPILGHMGYYFHGLGLGSNDHGFVSFTYGR